MWIQALPWSLPLYYGRDQNDYLPGTLELGQIQGKQYGLPLYQSLWAWGGNKKILEEAGIDWKAIQEKGWTWTEFKAVPRS